MRTYIVLFILLGFSLAGFSQDNPADSLRKDALNVFFVDNVPDFIKEGIPYVNYVRDRKDADLVIITSDQGTGSGGVVFTIFIEGQGRFQNKNDTLLLSLSRDELGTDVLNIRAINVIKAGLMRYIINTPFIDYFDISFTQPMEVEVSTDRWNNWVLNLGARANFNGNQAVNSREFGGNISVNKVTSKWRMRIGGYFNLGHTNYDYEGTKTKSSRKENRIHTDIVKSITEHLSVGFASDIYSSYYSNFDLGFFFLPAIEYNFYPYTESTRRQFTLFYNIGARYHNYSDTTQFFKIEEWLGSHQFQASYNVIEKFGTIGGSVRWSNYLHDFSLNNLSLGFNIKLNIAKGLNFSVYGNYSFVRDQISLRKGAATLEQVLTQQQELATTFSYHGGIGLNYTFGSIYSNVVNQRMNIMF